MDKKEVALFLTKFSLPDLTIAETEKDVWKMVWEHYIYFYKKLEALENE